MSKPTNPTPKAQRIAREVCGCRQCRRLHLWGEVECKADSIATALGAHAQRAVATVQQRIRERADSIEQHPSYGGANRVDVAADLRTLASEFDHDD
jgi:hypothetical protein